MKLNEFRNSLRTGNTVRFIATIRTEGNYSETKHVIGRVKAVHDDGTVDVEYEGKVYREKRKYLTPDERPDLW